jgi:hypothetical protein
MVPSGRRLGSLSAIQKNIHLDICMNAKTAKNGFNKSMEGFALNAR